MRMRLAGALLCGWSLLPSVRAQDVDPNLAREAGAVRAEVAHSRTSLRRYTWTEYTEVSVKGDVKSATAALCRYDASGELTKTPIDAGKQNEAPSVVSKRPINRKKGDMQDYIDRSISLIHKYVPPKPEQLQYLLQHGFASLGQSQSGKSEIRFTNYYQEGDSLVFIYDSASKALLRVTIASNLANPKDPVTLDADFETLPDGVNHLASATLVASAKKVQVKVRNVSYQKISD